MSDIMLFGVLRMPYEMAMEGEISRWQFWQRAQEAANRVEHAETELVAARELLREVLEEEGASSDTEAKIRSYLDACNTLGDGNG